MSENIGIFENATNKMLEQLDKTSNTLLDASNNMTEPVNNLNETLKSFDELNKTSQDLVINANDIYGRINKSNESINDLLGKLDSQLYKIAEDDKNRIDALKEFTDKLVTIISELKPVKDGISNNLADFHKQLKDGQKNMEDMILNIENLKTSLDYLNATIEKMKESLEEINTKRTEKVISMFEEWDNLTIRLTNVNEKISEYQKNLKDMINMERREYNNLNIVMENFANHIKSLVENAQ